MNTLTRLRLSPKGRALLAACHHHNGRTKHYRNDNNKIINARSLNRTGYSLARALMDSLTNAPMPGHESDNFRIVTTEETTREKRA